MLGQLSRAAHIEPTIYTDAELPFIPEQEAHGITTYRSELKTALGNREVHSLPHQELIDTLDRVGKTFHVLVLKTRLTLPYTSVFLQLDCKYWGAENEQEASRGDEEFCAALIRIVTFSVARATRTPT